MKKIITTMSDSDVIVAGWRSFATGVPKLVPKQVTNSKSEIINFTATLFQYINEIYLHHLDNIIIAIT